MNDERARLFVALELPDLARTALHQWRSEQLGSLSELRFVAAETLHLTLCFLGSQRAANLEEIAAACAAGVAGHERVVLGLGQPLWLPSPRRPRVAAVGLEDLTGDRGDGRLASLQAGLCGALAEGGWYEPEARPFRPHVTVARVARGPRVRGGQLPAPVPLQFVGSEVVLMRSRLGGGRAARYEAVSSIELS